MMIGITCEHWVNLYHTSCFIHQTLVCVVKMGKMTFGQNDILRIFIVSPITCCTRQKKVRPFFL